MATFNKKEKKTCLIPHVFIKNWTSENAIYIFLILIARYHL